MKYCTRYQQAIEADVDGQLSPGQAAELGEHLAACEECRTASETLAAEYAAISEAIREPLVLAAEEVDFDELWSGIEARMEPEAVEEPGVPEAPFFSRIFSWVLCNRTAVVSVMCAAGLLLVLAAPVPEPTDPNHCVVEEGHVGGGGGQVAVTTAQNKATGHTMTVIVLSEPDEESAWAEDETEDES